MLKVLAQWTYLPLHRVRQFELEILARSPDLSSLSASLFAADSGKPCAKGAIGNISRFWQVCRVALTVDAGVPADGIYRLALTADAPGHFVVAQALLRPADHVGGADPDVVRLLKQSHLPLLRWPGGNFVSSYHWQDGVGPAAARPTLPNLAWGGVETNLFGTDEFIAFCRAVGCEPMICVNAGSGTPQEAAQWIEYCNGPPDSPMGRRRAANGHPEPYRVRHWEMGNELWGRWQYHWTTATGYVDRFQQFHLAMRAADPTITLYACGAPAMWGKAWNDTLIKGAGQSLGTITDHPLIGGSVSPSADPLDVYRDFMAVPDVLASKWAGLQQDMKAAGLREPRLAVTELQMFAHLGDSSSNQSARLTRANLVNPGTLAEALYDVLIYHRAIRMAPFVSLVTHSATVNHGGGLRKEHERVYANPCYYAQSGFSSLAGARPVAVEATAPTETAPLVLPELKSATSGCHFKTLDALAALAGDGSLLLSLVHRGSVGPLHTTIHLEDFTPGPKAEVFTLTGDVPWAANTREAPEAVRPRESSVELHDGNLSLEMKPFTWVRVRIPRRAGSVSDRRTPSSGR